MIAFKREIACQISTYQPILIDNQCYSISFRQEINTMKDCNCIFCKIANGEIPSYTLYEDSDFRVILDINPVTTGHALIIPKEHYKNLYELDENIASKVLVVAKKLATAMTEELKCDGFNLLQNNEEIAGQTVFHFHMHLIPRYADDSFGFCTVDRTIDEKAATKLAENIKKATMV